MFTPPANSVVDHIVFMSPAISRLPWVDKDSRLVFSRTSLMLDNCFALFDLSYAFCCALSPSLADIIDFTSAELLLITSKLRFLKSVN